MHEAGSRGRARGQETHRGAYPVAKDGVFASAIATLATFATVRPLGISERRSGLATVATLATVRGSLPGSVAAVASVASWFKEMLLACLTARVARAARQAGCRIASPVCRPCSRAECYRRAFAPTRSQPVVVRRFELRSNVSGRRRAGMRSGFETHPQAPRPKFGSTSSRGGRSGGPRRVGSRHSGQRGPRGATRQEKLSGDHC